jgi:hypothetical protein
MNDLDTFAAYAMSALIGYSHTSTENYAAGAEQAYRWAEAMVGQQRDHEERAKRAVESRAVLASLPQGSDDTGTTAQGEEN